MGTMQKLLSILLLGMGCITLAQAQSSGTFNLAVVNLSSSSLGLSLDPNTSDLSILNIPPGTIQYLPRAVLSGNYTIHRSTGSDGFSPLRNSSGQQVRYNLGPNYLYLIILLEESTSVRKIEASTATGPAYALVNLSGLPLHIQVGKEWNQGTVIEISSLGNDEHSNFQGLAREYPSYLFWAEPIMPSATNRFQSVTELGGQLASRTLVIFPPKMGASTNPLISTLPFIQ